MGGHCAPCMQGVMAVAGLGWAGLGWAGACLPPSFFLLPHEAGLPFRTAGRPAAP